MPYAQVSMDEDLARQIDQLFNEHPGLWSSKRALWHDLVRRGILAITPSPATVHVPARPVGSAEVPAEVPLNPHPEPVIPEPRKTAAKGEARRSGRRERGGDAAVARGSHPESPAAEPVAPPPAPPRRAAEAAKPEASATPEIPARSEGKSPASPAAIAPAALPLSIWTCPTCWTTVLLRERSDHLKIHEARGRREGVLGERTGTVPVTPERTEVAAGSAAPSLSLDRLENFVLAMIGTGRLPDQLAKGKELAYLLAVARRGLVEQGITDEAKQPEDAVLESWIRKLASKSSAIKRILPEA